GRGAAAGRHGSGPGDPGPALRPHRPAPGRLRRARHGSQGHRRALCQGTMMPDAIEAARGAVDKQIAGRRPRIGLVPGAGLGAVAALIADAVRIGYDRIPGFPRSAVPGDAGELVAGVLGGQSVACLSGRAHWYEGHASDSLRVPIYTLRALGCEAVILTSA